MATHTSVQPGVVVSVVGPTAWKNRACHCLAQQLGTEIVSADARQVYRAWPLAPPSPLLKSGAARHHLVDFLEPATCTALAASRKTPSPCFRRLCSDRGSAILAGGSGMYVKPRCKVGRVASRLDLENATEQQFAEEGLAPWSNAFPNWIPAMCRRWTRPTLNASSGRWRCV